MLSVSSMRGCDYFDTIMVFLGILKIYVESFQSGERQ